MSNGYAADEPRHVEMAAIDEDIRTMAVDGARYTLEFGPASTGEAKSRALRVLRHFGLLVEHGDGEVSVKETPNG